MAAPRPGNTDRGWNDPPMFDYQGTMTASHFGTGSPQHHKLNKRVAYPMSSPPAAAGSCPTGTSPLLNPSEGPPKLPPVQILPPVSTTSTPTPLPLLIPTLSPSSSTDPSQPAFFSPPPPSSSVCGAAASVSLKVKDLSELLADLSLDSEESLLQFVRDGFTSTFESVKDAIKGRAMEDVKRKLGMMEECWTSGKISSPVKSQLGSLVAAVKKEEIEKAHELHLALMINHTAEVHQWLVAVKRIIQELRTRSSLSTHSGDNNTPITDPCFNVTSPNTPGETENTAILKENTPEATENTSGMTENLQTEDSSVVSSPTENASSYTSSDIQDTSSETKDTSSPAAS